MYKAIRSPQELQLQAVFAPPPQKEKKKRKKKKEHTKE
jgi:hypothetical protein